LKLNAPSGDRNHQCREPGEDAKGIRIENPIGRDQGRRHDGQQGQRRILEDEVAVRKQRAVRGTNRQQANRGVALFAQELQVRGVAQHQIGPGEIEILIAIADMVQAQRGDRIGE